MQVYKLYECFCCCCKPTVEPYFKICHKNPQREFAKHAFVETSENLVTHKLLTFFTK